MQTPRSRPAIGMALFLVAISGLGFYFVFAAEQGDYGEFRRVQAEAERQPLPAERDRLRDEVARMENLTRRLSDSISPFSTKTMDRRSLIRMGLRDGSMGSPATAPATASPCQAL